MGQQAMANRKPSESWDNLRYFLAVARTGTLSAAAEQLGTEHTTVARHVQALEEELDSRLFHRSNSGYGLTEVGGARYQMISALEKCATTVTLQRPFTSIHQRTAQCAGLNLPCGA